MASGFTITISAVDRASKVMDNITKRINAMNAPARRFKASFGKFMDAAGITRAAGAMRGLARSGLSAASSLLRIIEPMGILTSAASLAGLYQLTTSWARFGTQLGLDAQRIGIMPEKLQALQGAADLAGSSAGSLSSGLRGLHDNMVNAIGGRNNEALLYFRQLGINIGNMRQGARSVTEVLPQLADKIAALKDPTLQARVATATLGAAGEDLLPFLRMGAKGIQQYQAEMQRYGLTNRAGVDAANNLRMAQTRLGWATRGLAYSIAEQAAPGLQALFSWFTNIIAKNRELIAARVGAAIQAFASWIMTVDWQGVGDEINTIFENVQSTAKEMGGWKEVAKDVGNVVMEVLVARLLLGFGATLLKVIQITKALKEMAVVAAVAGGGGKGGLLWGALKLLGRTGLRIAGAGGVLGGIYFGMTAGKTPLGKNDTIMRGKALPDDIANEGRAAAARYGLNPNRFLSLLRTEQGGYNNVSPAGAFGPGQLMPGTARDLGVADSINDPNYTWQSNIDASARYFRQMVDKSQGNYSVAEARYNAGPSSKGVADFEKTGNFSALPGETQDYVRSIDTETAVAERQQRRTAEAGAPSKMTIQLEVHDKSNSNTSVRVRDVKTQGGIAPRVVAPMPNQ
ncbi:MAG: lytic transglycosylase domain-containing protein [Acetobacter orientalis]|uniref:lytic transglycosylase domain-containing protein n=1 Tax=Acetobacter orientalis TaxID=146474 RepID=UPI0039ED8D6F